MYNAIYKDVEQLQMPVNAARHRLQESSFDTQACASSAKTRTHMVFGAASLA